MVALGNKRTSTLYHKRHLQTFRPKRPKHKSRTHLDATPCTSQIVHPQSDQPQSMQSGPRLPMPAPAMKIDRSDLTRMHTQRDRSLTPTEAKPYCASHPPRYRHPPPRCPASQGGARRCATQRPAASPSLRRASIFRGDAHCACSQTTQRGLPAVCHLHGLI